MVGGILSRTGAARCFGKLISRPEIFTGRQFIRPASIIGHARFDDEFINGRSSIDSFEIESVRFLRTILLLDFGAFGVFGAGGGN